MEGEEVGPVVPEASDGSRMARMPGDTIVPGSRFTNSRRLCSRMGTTGGLEGRTLVSGLGWPADRVPAPKGVGLGWPAERPAPRPPGVVPTIGEGEDGVPAQTWA